MGLTIEAHPDSPKAGESFAVSARAYGRDGETYRVYLEVDGDVHGTDDGENEASVKGLRSERAGECRARARMVDASGNEEHATKDIKIEGND